MSLTVVITGGNGSIGRAIADRFEADGHNAVRFDIEGASDVTECDVSDEHSVTAAFERTVRSVGPVGVLVNAAGITGSGSIVDETPEDWRRIIDINLTGAYLCCRSVLPNMIELGSGSIVNVASVNARFGGSALSGPAYAASKGGLLTLTRFIAREHAKQGIRANAVAPGPHDTPMWQALDEERRSSILATLPGPGIGDPDDLAALVVFLCSPEAGYINGATIDVNGGQWMG